MTCNTDTVPVNSTSLEQTRLTEVVTHIYFYSLYIQAVFTNTLLHPNLDHLSKQAFISFLSALEYGECHTHECQFSGEFQRL